MVTVALARSRRSTAWARAWSCLGRLRERHGELRTAFGGQAQWSASRVRGVQWRMVVDAVVVHGVPAASCACPGDAGRRGASTGGEREGGGDARARGVVMLWASRVGARRALARHGRVLGATGRACADVSGAWLRRGSGWAASGE
jgi:hypothetical protein